MAGSVMALSKIDRLDEAAKDSLNVLWYAAYTSANHEKKVAEQLAQKEVENFLPLYDSVRRWKDRRVRLQLPLFPGYVFVRLPLNEKLKVLQVAGVARLVGFGDRPVSLPEEEMETLRRGASGEVRMEPHPYLIEGRRVRIMRGPLAGMEGILLRQKSGMRLVISIDLILRSIAVDVDAADVRPIERHTSQQLVDVNARRNGLKQ